MPNLTAKDIVFTTNGNDLSEKIKESLEDAAKLQLEIVGMHYSDLKKVTTKTNIKAQFARFIILHVLRKELATFDESYVRAAFQLNQKPGTEITSEEFSAVFFTKNEHEFGFKKSYPVMTKSGIGTFLLKLHSTGAIVLPASFMVPRLIRKANEIKLSQRPKEIKLSRGNDGEYSSLDYTQFVSSELIAFVRTIDPDSGKLPHKAFASIGREKKRREWFKSYGTKLLLIAGWHKPEDVNLSELLQIKNAEWDISELTDGGEPIPFPYGPLIEVLKAKYGDRVTASLADWDEVRYATRWQRQDSLADKQVFYKVSARKEIINHDADAEYKTGISDQELFQNAVRIDPNKGNRKVIEQKLKQIEEFKKNVSEYAEQWLELEQLYRKKVKKESYKPFETAIGYLNIYLFYYLRLWFVSHQSSDLIFPTSPDLLHKTLYISRLLESKNDVPATFMEYMEAISEVREWGNSTYYGYLKQIEKFFDFIELHEKDLVGCKGFTQPLSQYDYPNSPRNNGTNKDPMPRFLFKIYLNYYEALLQYSTVVTERVLCGELINDDVKKICEINNFVDTFANANLVGFIPVLFTESKTIPLQFIPNLLDEEWMEVKNVGHVLIPRPHTLIQNLVSLHTGIRHNHIQWLDAEQFDCRVDTLDTDFTILYVNTDKAKRVAWTPHVSMRVVELLRKQRYWRNLIDYPSFSEKQYYNDNPQTKWGKLLPLFSYTKDGRPHSDSAYTKTWQSMLCGIQGLLPVLTPFNKIRPLFKLLPPSFSKHDLDLKKRLIEYGDRFVDATTCPLRVDSSITPHSARVAVCSEYITLLPADVIGKYLTGQTARTVSHYVRLDRDSLEAGAVHQAQYVRANLMRTVNENLVLENRDNPARVHADKVNSSLMKGMKSNLEETIISHGCMSISFIDQHEDGLSVLKETAAQNAAYNKTEICPFNNNCPQDIVKKLRGFKRCSLCPYAVRSIDHLPPVLAKKNQIVEELGRIDAIFLMDEKTLNSKYTLTELDSFEDERNRLSEELVGWILVEEVLELQRQRIASNQDTRRWIVQKPEIIQLALEKIQSPTSENEYLMARLGESLVYPTFESPTIKARFDLMRRSILARSGKMKEAFAISMPIDPAAECAALIRTVLDSSGITIVELAAILEDDKHLSGLPKTTLRLMSQEDTA